MSDTIDYAEMLEIPVNTLNVTKKRSRKKKEEDLKEQVVEKVNERARAQEENVVDYGALAEKSAPPAKKFLENKLLLAEFVAVLALCAGILLTNIFYPASAINTFFRGIVEGTQTEAVDERDYTELEAGSIVRDESIACTVTDAGVLIFTGTASVYAPCAGTVERVSESGGTYTVEIRHTSSFSTVLSGLTYCYYAAGEEVLPTIPVGYSDGSAAVNASLYDDGSLIRSYSVSETGDIVWDV